MIEKKVDVMKLSVGLPHDLENASLKTEGKNSFGIDEMVIIPLKQLRQHAPFVTKKLQQLCIMK